MTQFALSCLACGQQLENIHEDCENQPSGGLAFRSYGHYGTTAFDPMDGSFIEITICDPCLVKAAEQQAVLWGRDRAVATVDGSVVGTVILDHPYALVPWQPELESHPQSQTLGWSGLTPYARDTDEQGLEVEPER